MMDVEKLLQDTKRLSNVLRGSNPRDFDEVEGWYKDIKQLGLFSSLEQTDAVKAMVAILEEKMVAQLRTIFSYDDFIKDPDEYFKKVSSAWFKINFLKETLSLFTGNEKALETYRQQVEDQIKYILEVNQGIWPTDSSSEEHQDQA